MVPLSIYKQELEFNGINPEIVKNIGTLGRKKNYRQDGSLNYIQENNVLENVYSTTHYDNNNKIQSNIIIDYTNNIRVNNYYSNNKKEVTEIEFYKNSVEKIKIIKNLETNVHSYHIEKTENGTLERIGRQISINEYNNELQKLLKITTPTIMKEIKELLSVKKIKPSI